MQIDTSTALSDEELDAHFAVVSNQDRIAGAAECSDRTWITVGTRDAYTYGGWANEAYANQRVKSEVFVRKPALRVAAPEASRAQVSSKDEVLREATLVWLATMPAKFRPVELARMVPRIANRLCLFWNDLPQWDLYLTSLLIDDRDGTRAGISPEVTAELAKLFFVHGKAGFEDVTSGR